MRITNKMMVDNIVQCIRRESEKLYAAQTKVATGKQINKPSDDPMAAEQILADRTTLSSYGQYRFNIGLAQTWVEVSLNNLEAANTIVKDIQTISLGQTTGDPASRDVAIEQVEALNAQLLVLANASYDRGYMYSGNCSDTAPFSNTISVSGGISDDIEFGLADTASTVSVEISDGSDRVVRTLDMPGGGIDGTNTLSWDGLDEHGNPVPDRVYTFSVNAVDAEGDPVAVYPCYRGDAGGKEVCTGENSVTVLNNNGSEMFESSLRITSELITALEAPDYDADVVSDLTAELDTAINQINAEIVALSNIDSQLQIAYDRLAQLTLNVESEIYDTEVGNVDQAVIELQAQQTAYEITLQTAAQILNSPGLLDYLD